LLPGKTTTPKRTEAALMLQPSLTSKV
jgi:hypothetical protein